MKDKCANAKCLVGAMSSHQAERDHGELQNQPIIKFQSANRNGFLKTQSQEIACDMKMVKPHLHAKT
jgi:hypothetical protein